MLVFGALFNLAVYYPLRNRGFQPVIISTIGASILLENGVLAAYGPRPQTLPGFFSFPGFSVGPIFFDSQYLLILGVTVVMVTLQHFVLRADAPRQEDASDLAGQGDGQPVGYPGRTDDHAYLYV